MEFFMNATIGQLIGSGFGVLAFLALFIEFTPIKWNPLSSILGWIGERTNQKLDGRMTTLDNRITDLETKVDEVSTRQEQTEAKAEEREAVYCRIRVLRFSDEIRRGLKHSLESFDQTLSDVTTYEQYCKNHPDFENQKAVRACERVKKEYDRCMDEDDFL